MHRLYKCAECGDIMCPHNECHNPDCSLRTLGCEMCDFNEYNKERERAGMSRVGAGWYCADCAGDLRDNFDKHTAERHANHG